MTQGCDTGFRWQLDEAYVTSDAHFLPESLAACDVGGRGVLLHERRGRVSVLLQNGWPGQGDLFAKFYYPRCWQEHIKYLVKPTRAAAEWRTSRALLAAGVPTPRPLGWGEKRTAGIWRGSVLLMAAVTPRTTLAAHLREHGDAPETGALVIRTADAVARLHAAGFFHGDLHGANIMLGPGDAGPVPHLVDLHEVRQLSEVGRRRRVEDLARLNSSVFARPRQRLAFLNRYLASVPGADVERLAWARDIDSQTRRIWRRWAAKHGNRIEKYV